MTPFAAAVYEVRREMRKVLLSERLSAASNEEAMKIVADVTYQQACQPLEPSISCALGNVLWFHSMEKVLQRRVFPLAGWERLTMSGMVEGWKVKISEYARCVSTPQLPTASQLLNHLVEYTKASEGGTGGTDGGTRFFSNRATFLVPSIAQLRQYFHRVCHSSSFPTHASESGEPSYRWRAALESRCTVHSFLSLCGEGIPPPIRVAAYARLLGVPLLAKTARDSNGGLNVTPSVNDPSLVPPRQDQWYVTTATTLLALRADVCREMERNTHYFVFESTVLSLITTLVQDGTLVHGETCEGVSSIVGLVSFVTTDKAISDALLQRWLRSFVTPLQQPSMELWSALATAETYLHRWAPNAMSHCLHTLQWSPFEVVAPWIMHGFATSSLPPVQVLRLWDAAFVLYAATPLLEEEPEEKKEMVAEAPQVWWMAVAAAAVWANRETLVCQCRTSGEVAEVFSQLRDIDVVEVITKVVWQ